MRPQHSRRHGRGADELSGSHPDSDSQGSLNRRAPESQFREIVSCIIDHHSRGEPEICCCRSSILRQIEPIVYLCM